MKPEKYPLYEGIDWAQIDKRLLFVATRSTAHMPDIFDGVSAEDLVNQTFETFFEALDGLGWTPKIGPLDRFLLGVLKHKMLDHIRRQKHIGGSLDDPDFVKNMQPVAPVAGDVRKEELYGELEEAARGDADLEQLVEAVPDIDGSNVNQQLASKLETTPEEIVNLKKRLVRRYKRNQKIDLP
jgi:DNA-directed RNA polymerase specialized sigma24 family protein